MALLKKLSTTAATSAAALLAVGTIATAPAQAALFKFSFTSDEANGYFLYDNSVLDSNTDPTRPNAGEYLGAVKEYYVDVKDKGVFQQTTGNLIVFLLRFADVSEKNDELLFEVRSSQQVPVSNFAFDTYFYYPEGMFGESLSIPNTVPSTALSRIFPNVNISEGTLGDLEFEGIVKTKIEAVPEPPSLLAVLGLGTWLLLRRRQRKQALHNSSISTAWNCYKV